MSANSDESRKSGNIPHIIGNVVGIIACIILIPILVINITLIIKSYTDKDKVPSFGGYVPMVVLTDSMYPGIQRGDLVICHTQAPENVEVGDIISFFDPDGNGTSVVTHRVVEIINENGLSFVTKGDANNAQDGSPVPADKLVGVYRTKLTGMGNLVMFMQSSVGFVVCIGIPLILLVGYDVIRRRLYDKKKNDDTAALRAEIERLKAERANAEEEKK